MTGLGTYPLRVTADLDQPLSRWLWLDRRVLRVPAYAGVMTEKYPPFRLDMGGHETGTVAHASLV